MRHRNLVFATILGLFMTFGAQAQDVEFSIALNGKSDLLGRKNGDPEAPQLIGRLTDSAGRSIRAAEITLICVDSDEVVSVRSNAFGFYQVSGLTNGHTYLVSVSHRRYLFVIGSESVTPAYEKTFALDFIGDSGR